MSDPREFRVHGTVEEAETGRPLAGLIVRAFDRDLVFDDKLGFATTDADGRFAIRLRRRRRSATGARRGPTSTCACSTRGHRRSCTRRAIAIRWNASHDEEYRIRSRRARSAGAGRAKR
jgi:hypothetical protein